MYVTLKGCIENQPQKTSKNSFLAGECEKFLKLTVAEVIWPLRKSWVFGMPQGIGYLDVKDAHESCVSKDGDAAMCGFS